MGTYPVRHIETKELQGIFWGSLEEIWDCMDELADPHHFEYAKLSFGALYSHAPIGQGRAVPVDDCYADDFAGFDWSGFEPSENFGFQLYIGDTLRWRRFDAADTGHGLVAQIFGEGGRCRRSR